MIFITGATGNVGREVVSLCALNKRDCIAAARRNAWETQNYIAYRYFDFEDPTTFSSLRGVTDVFLVRPPHISKVKKLITPFLEAAKEHGVIRIIFLSLIGVEKLPFVPHHKIEKEIIRLGFDYTFLRAGFFMQNLSTTHAREIREQKRLVAPCGNGRTTFIHARDIAEIGYKCLSGQLDVKTLNVAGNDTLTYKEIAVKLSGLLGHKITYHSPSVIGFILHRLRLGTPLKFALVMAGIYMPTRFGKAEYHGCSLDSYLGRSPISFDQFLHEERKVWE